MRSGAEELRKLRPQLQLIFQDSLQLPESAGADRGCDRRAAAGPWAGVCG